MSEATKNGMQVLVIDLAAPAQNIDMDDGI